MKKFISTILLSSMILAFDTSVFANELKQNVNIINSTQQNTNNQIIYLDGKQSVEIFKQLNKISRSYQNFTEIHNNSKFINYSKNGDEVILKKNIFSEGKYNFNENPLAIYNEINTTEFEGEKEVTTTKNIYKDGVVYLEKDGLKMKQFIDFDELISIIRPDTTQNITDTYFLNGVMRTLDNGYKEYMFNVNPKDFIKKEFLNQYTEENKFYI